MPLDTAEKRRSAASLFPFSPVSVIPNAAKDLKWRQQAGWGYSGIAAGAPLPGSTPTLLDAEILNHPTIAREILNHPTIAPQIVELS